MESKLRLMHLADTEGGAQPGVCSWRSLQTGRTAGFSRCDLRWSAGRFPGVSVHSGTWCLSFVLAVALLCPGVPRLSSCQPLAPPQPNGEGSVRDPFVADQ